MEFEVSYRNHNSSPLVTLWQKNPVHTFQALFI